MEIKPITKEMREELRKPLDAKAVSSIVTKPHLSSIKPIFITERLNSVFGLGAWQVRADLINPVSSEQKTSSKGRLYTEYTSLVKVIFTIPAYGVYYECIAGSTNEDEGDAVKGGISDCISKIGSWLEIGIDVYKGNGNKPTEQPKELHKLEDLKKVILASTKKGQGLIEFIRKAKANLDSKYSHAVDYKECVTWMNEKIIQLEGE